MQNFSKQLFRSNHTWIFHRKTVLKIFETITGKHPREIIIFKFLPTADVCLGNFPRISITVHYVISVQIRSFFWSAFSRIWTEYREIRSISPYSVRMPENTENTDQKELRNWTLFTKWRLLRISLDKCYRLLHEQFKLHFSVSMRKASYHCFFQRKFLPQKLSSVRNTIILHKSWKFDDLEKI